MYILAHPELSAAQIAEHQLFRGVEPERIRWRRSYMHRTRVRDEEITPAIRRMMVKHYAKLGAIGMHDRGMLTHWGYDKIRFLARQLGLRFKGNCSGKRYVPTPADIRRAKAAILRIHRRNARNGIADRAVTQQEIDDEVARMRK